LRGRRVWSTVSGLSTQGCTVICTCRRQWPICTTRGMLLPTGAFFSVNLPSGPVVVLVLSSYPAYPAFADVVLASEVLAADKTVADEAFIRHLRGAGRAFAGFSRDPRFADATDVQFDTLVSNWGTAMGKMADPAPASGGASDGNAAVDRLIQIHDLLDKNYEFLRGGYSMKNPFDFGDL